MTPPAGAWGAFSGGPSPSSAPSAPRRPGRRPPERRSRRLTCPLRRAAGPVASPRTPGFLSRLPRVVTRLALPAALLGALVFAAPAAAQSDTTFVKNTDQTQRTGSRVVGPSGNSIWQQAVLFTTGDNSAGYTLSEIGIGISGGIPANATPLVSIYTTASGVPDASLHTLTNPASFTASAVNTFTASANAALSANTTYAVVFDVSASSTASWSITETSSTDDDTGAASGWSIADDRKERNRSVTSTAWTTQTNGIPRIEIKGTLGSSSNNAPTVANPIPDQSITASTAFSYAFPANTFDDADGDTLTYTATQADGSALPVWLSFNASSRTFSGTVPAAGSHGDSASIKVTASDGTDSVSDTFDIVVNEVPTVANQIPDQTATAGTAFSFTFPANTFNDADASDTLTYTATKSDGTALPSWLIFTASSRTFSGTPAAADVETLSVKVTATDDTASASVSDTFDIVVSAAPSTSPAANTLVSNIDLTAGNIISFSSDIAQRFTTGANTSGYKLTKVDIGINGGSTAPGYTATIREGNAAAPSGTIAGTLTKPSLQSGQQNAQFTSSDGIDLKPNTPYWVMLDVSSPGSGHSALTTSSNNQTGEAGWAIMDTARWRAHDSTGGWTTNQHAVRIRVLGSAIPAALSSATADGTTLTLHFNGALDRTATAPAASAFTVTVGGTDQTPTGLAVGVSTVTLTLGTAVTAGQTVTVAYAKPAMNPLQDANGNEVDGFTGQAVTNSTGAAAVSGVAISSTPSNDADGDGTADTYGLGEKIRVQLTFGSAVTVDTSGGTPRLKIKLVQDKWANYESGSGTKVLTFAYTVVDGNASSGGTAVLADTLELNGGTITSGGSNADLAHGGLVHDLAHKVDASLMTDNAPPTFHGADVKGTTLAVTFDEALDTSSAPAGSVFTLSDGKAGTGTVSISGRTATVTLDSAVTAGAVVTLTYTKPMTNPLQDAAGNQVANFIGQAVTNNTGVPAVTGVAISSTPSHDTDSDNTPDTYGLNEKIRVQLTFDEAVTVDTTGGTPRLKIELVQEKWADYESGSGTTVLTFAYTVLAGNLSSDGIEVLADTLELNSGTITDSDGNNALLPHAAVARDANHKVNGGLSDSTAPTFQSAAVNGTTLTVTFNENLDTGSAPAGSAFTTSGSRTGTGTVSISGATATVTLDSAVTHGETVTVSYTLPGTNPLQDASGNDVATFTGQAVTNNTPAATPPTAANKLVSNFDQADDGSVGLDDDQVFGFTTGSPDGYTLTRVDLEMQDTAATTPTFSVEVWDEHYATKLGTLDQQGTLPSSFGTVQFTHAGIDLDAGTLYAVVIDVTANPSSDTKVKKTASANEDPLSETGWGISDHRQDRDWNSAAWVTRLNSTLKTAIYGDARPVPDVTNVAIVSTPAQPGNTYGRDEKIRVQLTFDEAVTVDTTGGTPRLKIKLALDKWADYESGSGTNTLTFAYTVVAENASTGIEVIENSLELNSGTIKSTATETDANLAHAAVARDTNHNVNGSLTDGTAPVFESGAVNGATLTLTFDEDLDRFSVPAASAFTASGGRTGTGTVSISGATATVTLNSAVTHGETVTVSYTPPGSSPLQDAAGNDVATFSGKQVTNNTSAPQPPRPPQQPQPPVNTNGAPVADAGADMEVDPEVPVALDGSGSSDPDGDTLAFAWSRASGVAVTLSGADTATPTFTAPWQPGALLFGLTVSDPGGLSDSDDVTVTVRDIAPSFGDAAVSPLELELDVAMDAVVLPEATGGNGALSYGLASAPAGLAGLVFDPAARRLSGTATMEGSYVFTYTAHDADDNRAASDAAALTFAVTVKDRRPALIREAVKKTLAAVARRALSSALENIGARFASSIPDTGLMLAGQSVPFGAAGTAGTEGGAGSCAVDAFHRHGFGAGSDECLASEARSRGVEAEELLLNSAFSLTLGATEGNVPPGPRWAIWGRGDLGMFAGRPEPGMRYEGELRTGWLGFDARAGQWVAGLAFSHGTGEADYAYEVAGLSGEGRLETTVNALYPYGRWTFADGLELRMVLGTGTGEARHWPEDEEPETSDLTMQMASLGVRRGLPALGGIDLAVRADASLARMETGSGPQYIDNLTADSWRGRLGLEASRRFALGEDEALVPFVEAAGRRDGGDGLTGAGLELAGGVRYSAPNLHVEARGRWLAAHAEEGAEERGVSLTARVGPGAQGRGLSLSLSPRWGASTGGAEALWGEEMPRLSGTGGEAASVDARIGYGIAASPAGMLTPFVETGLADEGSRRLRVGTRFDASGAALGVELSGERSESGGAEPEHALRFGVGLRF